MSNLSPAEQERFDGKWELDPSGCHLWMQPLDHDGYGTFYLRRRGRRAHRVAWFSMNGPIPPDRVINHTCRQRKCVNPEHLELVTVEENVFRNSRSAPALNALKTHCPKGHPYDAVMTVKGRRSRICTICTKERKRLMRQRWAREDTLAV